MLHAIESLNRNMVTDDEHYRRRRLGAEVVVPKDEDMNISSVAGDVTIYNRPDETEEPQPATKPASQQPAKSMNGTLGKVAVGAALALGSAGAGWVANTFIGGGPDTNTDTITRLFVPE